MARKQTQNPLEGQAPALTPTARPLQIPIGATPLPNRSPLMELAEAFREVNPELRAGLRDAAAREERDAMALGELEAQRTSAAQRMGEIEGTIKQAVDEGKVSHVRLPAFERGFRMRAGKELAQSLFQEKLTAQLQDATRVDGRVDPEKIIADTYAEVSKQIHPDDFFARAGFDNTAQGVIAGFRQRAAEGYTAEFKRAAEQKMADEGSEYLFQLATAASEDAPGIRENLRVHLDSLRAELPKSEVNSFFVQNVVAPAVNQLVSQSKVQEARHLLDEMENLDVTGKGGMLAQTAAAKTVFTRLRSQIDREAREVEMEGYYRLQRERDTQILTGKKEAADALQQLRLGADGKLNPGDRYSVIDQYRKANANDPVKVQAFAEVVHAEFENEDKWRTNERAIADLEVSIKSLKKEDIAAGRDRLLALWENHEIPASAYTRMSQHLDKLDALYGAIDEGDFKAMKRDLYFAPTGIAGQKTINFGGDTAQVDQWEKLPETLREEHESKTTAFFSETLQAELRAVGDPNKIAGEKAQVLDRVTLKTREFARGLLKEMTTKKRAEETAAKIKEQSTAQKLAATRAKILDRSTLKDSNPPVSVYRVENIPNATPEQQKLSEWVAAYRAEKSKPAAERDIVQIPLKERGVLQLFGAERHTIVSLPALAEASKNKDDDAGQTYAYAKSLTGFTPEEIKAGKTKHGVVFNPTQIDPYHIPVFRDRAELEKHWNNGEPSATFLEIGDIIDPTDRLNPADLYLSQLALLRHNK